MLIILTFPTNSEVQATSLRAISTNNTFEIARPFNCTTNPGDCENLGRCDPDSNGAYCDCLPQYAGPGCDYKRKSQTVAFLLTFFLGYFGAGRLYLGLYASAIPKLCIWLLFGVPCCPSSSGGEETSEESVKACVSGVICMMFVWWLTDVIIIGVGDIPDGHGVNMNTW